MLRVVLAEYEIFKVTLFINDRKGVELMLPDDVVSLFKSRALGRYHELVKGSHKGRYLLVTVHTAYAVVTAGNDAEELAVCGAVLGNGHGAVTVLLYEIKHVGKSIIGSEVGIAYYKACLVILHPCYHCRLVLNGLVAVDEGYAALFSKRDSHSIIGYRLHYSRHHGNVHHKGALLLTLSVLNKRGAERYVSRNASFVGVAGDKKILAKGMRRFVKIGSHSFVLTFIMLYF